MNEGDYTLPGVMRFLQLEWQRNERDRIQWDIERAEMKSRIAKLEGEQKSRERELAKLKKTISILEGTKQVAQSSEPDQSLNHPLDVSVESFVQARDYLDQCVSEVRYLLEQSGVGEEVADLPVSASQSFGARSRLYRTLANFGAEATAVLGVLGNLFLIGTDDGRILVWEIDFTDFVFEVETSPPVIGLFHDEAANQIVAVSGDGLVSSWDIDLTGKTLKKHSSFYAHENVNITSTAWWPDRRYLATCSTDGFVSVWEKGLEDSCISSTRYFPETMANYPTSAHFHETRLFVGYSDGGLILVDPISGQLVKRLYSAATLSSAFAAVSLAVEAIVACNDNIVITGHATGDIRVFDLFKYQLREEISSAHKSKITSLALSPQNSSIVSTSTDGQVCLWTSNLGSFAWYGRLLSHDSFESSGALCCTWTKENFIAIGGGDGLVRVYSMS